MRHFNKLKPEFLRALSNYIGAHQHSDNMPCEASLPCEKCAAGTALPRRKNGFAKAPSASAFDASSNIVLPEKQPTFQQSLFALIDSRGLKDSTVYKCADIDRRLFAKIRADVNYHPSKPTAIKLCLALELDIAEAERLLETAGYCLSFSDTGDLVVRYCIENGEYRLINVNEALDYFDAEIL